MKPDLVQYLVCPEDRTGAIEIAEVLEERRQNPEAPGREIWRGSLVCTECGRLFPVVDGIPCLLPDILRDREVSEAEEYTLREARLRGAGARSHEDLYTPYDNLVELAPFARALQGHSNGVILEIGCGSGRLTRCLYRIAARVIAVDIAFESLDVLRSSLKPPGQERVDVVLASATSLPLRPRSVDAAASSRAFCSMPRDRGLVYAGVAEALKCGGPFAVNVLNLSRQVMRQWPSGEKMDDDVFLKHFRPSELAAEIGQYLRVEKVQPVLCFRRRLSRLDWLGLMIERAMESTRLGFPWARLLFALARAPVER